MRLAATICLVESIPVGRGPWLFWHDLESGCEAAAALGYDGIELFSESPDQTPADDLGARLERHGLALAALGTGAGKVVHGLDLAHPDPGIRARARAFVAGFVELGGRLGAPVIVGSMQGSRAGGGSRELLRDELRALSRLAGSLGTQILLEPLNRYEGDLFAGLGEARDFLDRSGLEEVDLLADLFHMNIEEVSIADALRAHGARVSYVHFADSNRRAPGFGHTDFRAVAAALHEVGFEGFLSPEVFPYPDPRTAAERAVRTFRDAEY